MFKWFLVAAASVLATSAVQAQTSTPWKEVGDWELVVDSRSGGCLMQKFYDNGILLQFGLLPEREAGFFAAYREEWTDIQYGKKAPVKFSFDGEEFKGQSTGTVAKPWYGGFAETQDRAMVYDFAKKYNMVVTGPRGREFELSLDGTLNAVRELEACQAAQ